MIENIAGNWKCKICGKTSATRSDIGRHAEIHLQGVTHCCNICMKTFSSRHTVANHKSYIPSKLYRCGVCGKKDMNNMTVSEHKYKCIGAPEEQKM